MEEDTTDAAMAAAAAAGADGAAETRKEMGSCEMSLRSEEPSSAAAMAAAMAEAASKDEDVTYAEDKKLSFYQSLPGSVVDIHAKMAAVSEAAGGETQQKNDQAEVMAPESNSKF